MKTKLNSDGFSPIEATLVLVIVVVIIVVGWIIVNHKPKSVSAKTAVTTKPLNPYGGWNSYSLKFEKASFNYPPDWIVTDGSLNGSDSLQLEGANNFEVDISTGGNGQPSSHAAAKVLFANKIKFNHKNAYLDYVSTSGDGKVEQIYLSPSATNNQEAFPSKAVDQSSEQSGNFVLTAEYLAPNSTLPKSETLAQALVDPSYNDTKLLILSIKY